jgi:anti-sigma regulatory factor (Ser/Thr protein kinase)
MRLIYGSQVRIPLADEASIAASRKRARELAEQFEFDEVSAGRIGIIATELAANAVRHGARGELLLQVLDDGVTPELEILALDRGPGMHDLDECREDGYSSSGAPGLGLGTVERLSNTFDIFTGLGHGTVVMSRTQRKSARARPEPRRSPLEVGAISFSAQGENGALAAWRIAEQDDEVAILLVDAQGHGPPAAAQAAATEFVRRPFEDPQLALARIDRALIGTGAVAGGCARLNGAELNMRFAAVGDISGHLIASQRAHRLLSGPGALGVKHAKTQEREYRWPLGSRVVMHSLAVSERWSIADYPGLHLRHSAVIAGVLYRDYVSRGAKVTILVACHRS